MDQIKWIKWIILIFTFWCSFCAILAFLQSHNDRTSSAFCPQLAYSLLVCSSTVLCLKSTLLFVSYISFAFFFVLAFFYFYLLFLIPLHVSFGDFQNVTLTYQKIPAGFHFLTTTWETLHAEFMSLENFYLNRQDVEGLNVEKLQVITNFDLIVSDIV